MTHQIQRGKLNDPSRRFPYITPNAENLEQGRKGHYGRAGYSLLRALPGGRTDLWPSLCSRPPWQREKTEHRGRRGDSASQAQAAARGAGEEGKKEKNPTFSSYDTPLLFHPLRYPVNYIYYLHFTDEKTRARQGPRITNKRCAWPSAPQAAPTLCCFRESRRPDLV